MRICRSAREATDGYRAELALALGHSLLGLLCIVSQRNILRQIFGYCLMENGSHLVLALLAWRAHVNWWKIGIATDAIFAVIVTALLARKIWRTHGTLDVNLTALKDNEYELFCDVRFTPAHAAAFFAALFCLPETGALLRLVR